MLPRCSAREQNSHNKLFFRAEVVFIYAAKSAFEILGKIFPLCAGLDTEFRCAQFFVINPSAYIAYIFHSYFLLIFWFVFVYISAFHNP